MDKILIKGLSFSLLTIPAVVLTIHRGINVSAILILILSLSLLTTQRPFDLSLNKKEKCLIFPFIILPIVIAFDVILRGVSFRYLDYYLRFILVLPIYFALRQTKVDLRPFMGGILIGAIGAGILALFQKFYLQQIEIHGHVLRINFGNISLLLGFMSVAGLFLVRHRQYKKTTYALTFLAFVLGITGSILSGTRGGWIAIPCFMIFFLMYFPTRRVYKLASVAILAVLMGMTYQGNEHFKSRINLAYTSVEASFLASKAVPIASSTGIRLEIWKAAWCIITENPVFGIGSGQFKQALKTKMDQGEIKKIQQYSHVHNEPLHFLVITGVVGLLAYLLVYLGAVYYFYRALTNRASEQVRYLGFLGILLVSGYFIFGLTNYSFGHNLMVIFFALMIVVIAGLIRSIECFGE